MKTLKELISTLEANNIKYIVQNKPNGIDFDDDMNRTQLYDEDIIQIGFALPKQDYIYYWFEGFISNEPIEEALMFFNERYNTNIGKSIKTWKTGYNIERKLEQLSK